MEGQTCAVCYQWFVTSSVLYGCYLYSLVYGCIASLTSSSGRFTCCSTEQTSSTRGKESNMVGSLVAVRRLAAATMFRLSARGPDVRVQIEHVWCTLEPL
jgi:hypothetical protein